MKRKKINTGKNPEALKNTEASAAEVVLNPAIVDENRQAELRGAPADLVVMEDDIKTGKTEQWRGAPQEQAARIASWKSVINGQLKDLAAPEETGHIQQ